MGRSKFFKATSGQTRYRFILNKTVWFLCTSRSAIIVLLCLVVSALLDPDITQCKKVLPSIISAQLSIPILSACSTADRLTQNYSCTFMLTGDINGTLPPFKPPPFKVSPFDATNPIYKKND